MALSQAHNPDRPVSVGKYELLGLLGAGGMAEVFLARAVGPMGFERRVVVKRILPHLSRDEEFVQMFVGEAKVSAVLSHGNIVQVYDFGEADGQLFLAMEHVDGTDLRSLARKAALAGTPLPPELSVFIATELLSALAYAHDRADWDGEHLGLVHRDVSPSNVLLSRAGEVKLCDFGIAKIAARHTSTGRLKGKFAYMSPEQAAGAPVDGRSDLWSVGVVLWELLAGRKLFTGESDVAVLAQVSRGEIARLPPIRCAAEPQLRAAVERALERDPARRHLDATAMAEDLREVLAAGEARDPSRMLRELVQRFAVEPVLGAVTAVARPLPPPRLATATTPSATLPRPVDEGPTEQHGVPASPPTHSAIVEVRRSPALQIVLLVLVFGAIAVAILVLWPAPDRPTPHSTPGWPPAATAPLLPRLPPRPPAPAPSAPPRAVAPASSEAPVPAERVDAVAPTPSAEPGGLEPDLAPAPPAEPAGRASAMPPSPARRGERRAPAATPSPRAEETEPAPERPAAPAGGSTRETTVDPFAIP